MAKVHGKPTDPKCSVCNHENCDLIEELYLRWNKDKEIAKEFGLVLADLKRHVEALDLTTKKMKNTRELVAKMADAKFQDMNPDEIPWPVIEKLIKHTDVVEGRVVHKTSEEKPRLVAVMNLQIPGAQVQQTVIEGEVVVPELSNGGNDE